MYYVNTRRALKNGAVVVSQRRFQTRKAQRNYIAKAPMSIAITGYN